MKIKINATNLHSGGGLQVAVSFFFELFSSCENLDDYDIYISSEIYESLRDFYSQDFILNNCSVYDSYGFFGQLKFNYRFKSGDIVFDIFGPAYSFRRNKRVTGFAQAWILYPCNPAYNDLSCVAKIKSRIKYYLQYLFFKRSDVLIVELDFVKSRLLRNLGFKGENIRVVKNCISSIYRGKDVIKGNNIVVGNSIKAGYIGRNYLHKNTKIFPEVAFHLKEKYNINIKFHVTFTDDEWLEVSDDFKKTSINHGVIKNMECIKFYNEVDIVVFPSLLECFSATPLEAMAMMKPLFASDTEFNRDICDKFAFYFNPSSPEAVADLIYEKIYLKRNFNYLEEARVHSLNFSDPKSRMFQYIEIMKEFSKE